MSTRVRGRDRGAMPRLMRRAQEYEINLAQRTELAFMALTRDTVQLSRAQPEGDADKVKGVVVLDLCWQRGCSLLAAFGETLRMFRLRGSRKSWSSLCHNPMMLTEQAVPSC